jgi:integrase
MVQVADLERFQAALTGEALLAKPDATLRDAVQAWNRCVKNVPGWPQLRIERQSRKEVYSLPWSAFPESLKTDVDGWLRRLSCDVLDDEGPVRAVKPSTLATREYQLRTFASVLVRQGVDAGALTSLSACLTPEHYKLGLKFFLDRHAGKSSSAVHSLAGMLTSVARHWLKLGQPELDVMKLITKRVAVSPQGMTQKNRDRLRPLLDRHTAERLLQLPKLLMDQLARGKVSNSRRKVVAQMAVAIEILLMAPIRIGNLSMLHLDRNLVRVGKHYHLVIDGSEVKNGRDLEFELPEESCRLIDLYLTEHREADPDNRYLFPGRTTGPKGIGGLRQQIERAVKDYTGLEVNPHLFRHIAAAIYLDANPNGYEVVRRLLGHKSIDTTTAFYIGLRGLSAGRHYAKTIVSMRQGSTVGGHQ